MTHTRRTALAMLGLGAATAVGAETFNADPERSGTVQGVSTAYRKERYAQAFEKLAQELRADRVHIHHLKLSASLEANAIADVHDLHLQFRYEPEV
jgi:hypothetical protein